MTQSADQQDNFSRNHGALVTGERDVTETVYTWSRDKFSLVIVRRSIADMYTAHACVVKEMELHEAQNCGTGPSLDCCLKVLRV